MKRLQFALSLIAAFLCCSGADLSAQKLTNPTKLYRGIISSTENSSPVHSGSVLVFEDPYPEPVTSSKINTGTGEYSMILDPSKIYRLRIEADGYYTSEVILSTPAGSEYQELDEPFEVMPIPKDSVLFSGVPFTDGTNTYADGSGIREAVRFLAENPSVTVVIGVGLVEDKVDPVTKKRVDAIKELFREFDVSTTRIDWDRRLDMELGQYVVKISGFKGE